MQVFSREWFAEHQAVLLRFSNSRYGRRLLRLDGGRSAVGAQRIIRIEPHAITWRNADGSYSTELRTHDKYAKRLYHGLKPLWYGMHAWDMAIANRFRPALNLGFDSLTAYPEAGEGTLTVDGYTYRIVEGTGETLNTIRARSGTFGTPFEDVRIELVSSDTTNRYSGMSRGLMTFDTSGVPTGADVTAATLSLFLDDKGNELGNLAAHIVSATPNQNNRISMADFQRLGDTSFGSIGYNSMTLNAYNGFTLNSSGRSSIVKGGISAFGVRSDWYLLNSYTGSWSVWSASWFIWTSADNPGTAEDPKLVVTYSGVQSASISGTLRFGGSQTAKVTRSASISGTLRFGGQLSVRKDLVPVAGKEYVYRWYKPDGTYGGVWRDVRDELQFTQRLNTPGTTTTVLLARSVNTTTEKRDTLITDDGEVLITDDGEELIANYVTNNTVGEDTDVDLNYNVDVYVHYGGFETLETDDGQTLVDDDGEELLFSIGAPLGRRVFSGWIMDYAATYGNQDGLEVTLASHGSELANQVINSAGVTTVNYSGVDHGQVIRNLLAMNSGGKIGAGTSTVANTGTTISPTFRLNTILEGIKAVYDQSPDGWYWYGNVAENEVQFQQKSATPQHTFVLGKHIQSLKLSRSIENLKNELYFVGGDTGSGILYKKYTTTSSVSRKGLDRQTDRRVTLTATAQKRADKTFARYKDPIYTTSVTIPAEVYEIEEIELGDVVTFANFGNFIDGLKLQIVARRYSPNSVELELGDLLERQADIVSGIVDTVQEEQYETIPSTPS